MKRYVKSGIDYQYRGRWGDYLSPEERSEYNRGSNQRIRESGGKTIRFSPKATVTNNGGNDFVLTSYTTDVAEIKDGKIVYADYRVYSTTTDRDIHKFIMAYADDEQIEEWQNSKTKTEYQS